MFILQITRQDYCKDTIDMINKAADEEKEMLICGDFNMDYKLDENLGTNKVKQLEDLFLMQQLVSTPTRVENNTETIIDLILTTVLIITPIQVYFHWDIVTTACHIPL